MTFVAQITCSFKRPLLVFLFFSLPELSIGQNSSDLAGFVSISLKNGTSNNPSYMIVSPGSKEKVIYEGLALSVSENNVSFSKRWGDLLSRTVSFRRWGQFDSGCRFITRARADNSDSSYRTIFIKY